MAQKLVATRYADEVCNFCYTNRKRYVEMRADNLGDRGTGLNAAFYNNFFDTMDETFECVCGPKQSCRDTYCRFGV